MTASVTHSASIARRSTARDRDALQQVLKWFDVQGWEPFRFQQQAWTAQRNGDSGLIHATTGTGKTYAAWMGPLLEWLARSPRESGSSRSKFEPLRVLWLTPLRALAADTLQALELPLRALEIPWTIETRTSDTSSSVRNRQRVRLPTALITTPESLSLMLTRADAAEQFSHLQTVVVDEWHELLASKRGVQTELCLARLRRWRPQLKTWGLSATLGNTAEAMQVLLGRRNDPPQTVEDSPTGRPSEDATLANLATVARANRALSRGVLIEGMRKKQVHIDSVIPPSIERFPWAGHLGLRLAPAVAAAVDAAESSLIFTNTRSQTEAWYQALLKLRPGWAGKLALHHGSLDRSTREWVEDGLRAGKLKCVVCTSSLDLGVDFSPVDRVFQIGSPKGVARLLQRAGRSGHSPGRDSRVTCVPANALELLEFAAAKDAIAAGNLEGREPASQPLDLLAQHAASMAMSPGGFNPDELFDEVRTTTSFAELPRRDWEWVLAFISTGGEALKAYPDYHKVRRGADDRYYLDDRRLALQHRLSIGTIVSEATLTVQYLKGAKLGTIEENFLARLKPGDQFIFAGQAVELVQVQDSKVFVRKAKSSINVRIPRWMGGRIPLSTKLSDAVRRRLDAAARGEFEGPELCALRPLLELQAKWSRVPRYGELLVERAKSRDGHHLYLYPFAGRLVHEGLAALLAYRMSRRSPITFSMSVNDYGFELLSPTLAPFESALQDGLFDAAELTLDIAQCMNAAEMARRQFREIASIAGLVFNGFPGQRKTARQLQASSGLLFDVFRNHDPHNLLLRQAQREVLERQLEHSRLVMTLKTLSTSQVVCQELTRFSPLCFPLLVERLRERLSSEKLADRVRRMQETLERAADKQS